MNNYLVPRFGKYRLVQITTSDVKAMLAEELDAGRLSSSAVRRHVLVLRVILERLSLMAVSVGTLATA